MNRLERLYAISDLIRRSGRRPVSAGRLAEEFDVSTRTIERDVASLREAGAPLVGEPGRNGGVVSLDRGTGLVVTLTTPQVTALLMAVAVAGPDMPYAKDASTGAATLVDQLATNTKVQVDELRSRVRGRRNAPAVRPRVRRTVEEAVRRGRVVNLTYVDAESTTTERAVEAVGFYEGTDGWFLIGWCELRSAPRLFRLDRIQSARSTRRRNQERDLDEVLGWVPHDVAAPSWPAGSIDDAIAAKMTP